MKLRASALLVLASTVLLAPAALASWPNTSLYNLPVCTFSGDQRNPVSTADGSGGMIVAWPDPRTGNTDLYAQHLLFSGELDPAWPATGRLVCGAAGFQGSCVIVGDGAGGAVVAWVDLRSGSAALYAQHVSASGVVDPTWPVNGRLFSGTGNNTSDLVMVSDGAGGAVIAWCENRVGTVDLYAHHVRANGTVDPAWPVNGRAVCTAAGDQVYPAGISDGAGGMFLTWHDLRSGLGDIYAHRVRSTGVTDPAWPVNGRAVCALAEGQYFPGITTDGAGGAIIAWEDIRNGVNFVPYAQHVSGAGVLDAAWPADGVSLSNATGVDMLQPALVADGAGGAIVVWNEAGGFPSRMSAQRVLGSGVVAPGWPAGALMVATRPGMARAQAVTDGEGGALVPINRFSDVTMYDYYVQRVPSTGVLDPTWPDSGQAVCVFAEAQYQATVVADGVGGAILCWGDQRNSTQTDLYAGRIGRHAQLGTPEPVITAVEDIPNDQGGTVRVRWNTSYLDTPSNPVLTAFDVFRRPAVGNDPWSLVGTVTPTQQFNYAFLAPTGADSTAAGTNAQLFRVRARDGAGRSWDSQSHRGFSIDDLAPATPAAFTSTASPGTLHLHWSPGAEPDLAGYRLYRSATFPMVRDASTLLATPADTGYADVTDQLWVYQLTAVDVHGNESAPVTLFPDGSLGVPGERPLTLDFAAPAPNPARNAVSLRFTLPAAAPVRFTVHDAAGRLIREFGGGVHSPGVHTAWWDTRDAGGRPVHAGLYFVELHARDEHRVRRVVVTR